MANLFGIRNIETEINMKKEDIESLDSNLQKWQKTLKTVLKEEK